MAWTNIPALTDWQYDDATKKLRHNAGTARVTVNALYSAIMDLVDDSSFMDDTVPMRANTPTEYELINGWTFNADSDVGYLTGGSVKVNQTDDLWANYYNLGTLAASTPLYIEQNGALVASPPGYTTGDLDALVKVRSSGADVNSRKVSLFARKLGDRYDNFEIQAPTTGGRNPVPVGTEDDVNDDASGGAVAGVVIAFGTVAKDIGDGAGGQNYDVAIDGGGNSLLGVYRRLKYLTRDANTSAIDSPDNTTPGRFYLAASGIYSQVKSAPFGTYAGGKLFGARGVWIENVSDPNNRVLIDAAGTTRTPPVSITASVTGVVSGDRVLMARSTGAGSTTVNKTQFTLNGAHSSGGATVVVSEAVPNDVSSSGVIRVNDDRYPYSSLNRGTKTFTLSGTLYATYSGGTGAYVPLIDDVASAASIVSPTMTYVADIDVVYRVRKKGILPFENSGVVSSAGLSAAAIRTADTVVT